MLMVPFQLTRRRLLNLDTGSDDAVRGGTGEENLADGRVDEYIEVGAVDEVIGVDVSRSTIVTSAALQKKEYQSERPIICS